MTRTQAVRTVASALAFNDPPLISGRGAGILDKCRIAAGVVVDQLSAAGVLDVTDDRVTDVPLNGDGTDVFAGTNA